MEKLEQVKVLLKNEKAIDARELLEEIPETGTVDYWLVKGAVEQRFQHWGKAFNAYSNVLNIEPENNEAKQHLQMINGILSFWNPDQFNP